MAEGNQWIPGCSDSLGRQGLRAASVRGGGADAKIERNNLSRSISLRLRFMFDCFVFCSIYARFVSFDLRFAFE